MAQARVVRAWKDGSRAWLAVVVDENGESVEYIGSLPLAELEGLTIGQQKAKLGAAVKAERDRRIGGIQELAGIGGTVSL